MASNRLRRSFCILGAIALMVHSFNLAARAQPVELEVRWVNNSPGNSLLVSDLVVAAHDGHLDFYDYERPLPLNMLDQIMSFLRNGLIDPTALMQAHDSVVRRIYNQPFPRLVGTPPPLYPGHRAVRFTADPTRHRYFSFLGAVAPSNDAFIGNEDPFQHELFDSTGRFQGPLLIEVFGNQVMDAGLCVNTETGIRLLDTHGSVPCQEGEGRVTLHPGLNGSRRNPDGEPQRVLGGTYTRDGITLNYDPILADFSITGYRMGYLVIKRVDRQGPNLSGGWYSRERAGEGFNIEWLDPMDESGFPHMIVNWYTYEPDGSGRQVWLAGSGPVDPAGPGIPLHRTQGGQFASTSNPAIVERIPWGHIAFSFSSCEEGEVRYTPSEAGWTPGSYPIHRLALVTTYFDARCWQYPG